MNKSSFDHSTLLQMYLWLCRRGKLPLRPILPFVLSLRLNNYHFPREPCRSLPPSIDPVSYTHLDVYKRQLFHLGSLLFYSLLLVGEEKEAHQSSTQSHPVSYTHLDVYKRQPKHIFRKSILKRGRANRHKFLLLYFRKTHFLGRVTKHLRKLTQGHRRYTVANCCLLYTSRCV